MEDAFDIEAGVGTGAGFMLIVNPVAREYPDPLSREGLGAVCVKLGGANGLMAVGLERRVEEDAPPLVIDIFDVSGDLPVPVPVPAVPLLADAVLEREDPFGECVADSGASGDAGVCAWRERGLTSSLMEAERPLDRSAEMAF